jgi:hypothetical protein
VKKRKNKPLLILFTNQKALSGEAAVVMTAVFYLLASVCIFLAN